MPLFAKKPRTVEAVQWTGTPESLHELRALAGDWLLILLMADTEVVSAQVSITTPSGTSPLNIGDWVVKNHDHDFYPVTSDNFAELFDPAATRKS
jgi:hypothetical protein